MTRARMASRCVALAAVVLTCAGVVVAPAGASWSAGGAGTAASKAATMPGGGQPSARASGSSVTVQWPIARLPGDAGVAGYVVHRFNATTGAESPVGAGCAGAVAATTCTEVGVPVGTWTYAVVPVQDLWTGAISAPSVAVSVT
ncbi:MAG: hypothetical protein ACHQFZ_06290 [Acidimicrobiales bacterium]